LGLRFVRYPAGQVMEFHRHDEATVGVIVGGTVAETANGKTVVQRTGALVVKPPGLWHRNQFGPNGAVMLSLRNLDPDDLPKRWSWSRIPGVARDAIGILAELAAGDLFGAAQERAWRLVGLVTSPELVPAGRAPPPWLTQIRDEIADAGARPSVARLARSAGVHPVYLTRLFSRHFGYSISGFFRRIRIERAAESLLGSSERLATIAAQHGFSDQSHFCRVFKSELGFAPSAYRVLVAAVGERADSTGVRSRVTAGS
jgi:AraC family transcriptional regulator